MTSKKSEGKIRIGNDDEGGRICWGGTSALENRTLKTSSPPHSMVIAFACLELKVTTQSWLTSFEPLTTPPGKGPSKYCSHRCVRRKCRSFQLRRPPFNQFLCPSGPPPFFSQTLSNTTGKPHTTAPSPRIICTIGSTTYVPSTCDKKLQSDLAAR